VALRYNNPLVLIFSYLYHIPAALRYNSRDYYNKTPELRQAIDQIASGFFSPEDRNLFHDLTNILLNDDKLVI